jgi:hypothetical protein
MTKKASFEWTACESISRRKITSKIILQNNDSWIRWLFPPERQHKQSDNFYRAKLENLRWIAPKNVRA